MKSYIIALMIAVAAALMGTDTAKAAPKRLKGSGEIVTRQVELPAFHAVKASRAVKVAFVADEGQPCRIEADDNVMEYVVAKVSNGVLHLTIDDEVRTLSSIHVKITVPTNGQLHTLKASSAAEIRSEVLLEMKTIEIEASSAAKINARVQAEESAFDLSSAANVDVEVMGGGCSIEATSSADFKGRLAVRHCKIEGSSASNITIEGAAITCEADLSSAADLNATRFAVKNYDIEVSSAADADILCIETLNASASSAGDITYLGNCEQRRISRSSGGSIKHR